MKTPKQQHMRRAAPLVALLLAYLSHIATAAEMTRSSGMINYPEPSREPTYRQNYDQQQQQFDGTKIRIQLTRNITLDVNSNRLRAPDVSYFGAIGLGAPAKMFNVVFDTRSSEIWFPGYNWFPFANNLHYSDGYDCKESRTCHAQKRDFTFDYRNTRLSGETYDDSVTLFEDMGKDDARMLPSRTLKFRQNFILVSDADNEQFRYKPYDGVVGLSPMVQSSAGITNFLLSMQKEFSPTGVDAQSDQADTPMDDNYYRNHHQLRQRFLVMFGLWFNPNQNSRHGGELTLGGIDENRFTGDIFYHKLTSWMEWQVYLTQVMMGSQVVSCASGCNAILDTGANSIVGPREDVESIYQSLQAHYDEGSNLWLVECQQTDQYPTIMFRIDDTPYYITPRHYIKLFKHKDNVVCHLAIRPWDETNWLLGTSFIGSYYTVYDFANRRLGFATPRG